MKSELKELSIKMHVYCDIDTNKDDCEMNYGEFYEKFPEAYEKIERVLGDYGYSCQIYEAELRSE